MTEEAVKTEEMKPSVELSEKLEGIMKTIEELTVIELATLVKALEEKFGVSAAAAVAVAAPVAGAAAGAEQEEEKDSFSVVLTGFGEKKINVIKEKNILHLDYVTQRNLELIHSLWERGKDFTLYNLFNHTDTPMGARLLRKFILQPLTDIEQISYRLNIVQKF